MGRYHPLFFDDFNDGSLSGWNIDTPVGSVSESGSELTINVSGNGDWWYLGPGQSPMVYRTFTSLNFLNTQGLEGPIRFESRMTFLTAVAHVNGLSCLWRDRYNVYLTYLGDLLPNLCHGCTDVQVGVGVQTFYDSANLIPAPIGVGVREVSYYNPPESAISIIAKEDDRIITPGTVAWYISNDNGTSYIYKAQDTSLAWRPTRIGLGLKNWGPRPPGSVKFDWAMVEVYSDDVPEISNQDPAQDETEVEDTTDVQFDLLDAESAVDISTIRVHKESSLSNTSINETDNFDDESIDSRFEITNATNFGGGNPTWTEEASGVVRMTTAASGGYSTLNYKDTAFPDLLTGSGMAETKVTAYSLDTQQTIYAFALLHTIYGSTYQHLNFYYGNGRLHLNCNNRTETPVNLANVSVNTPLLSLRQYWNLSDNFAYDADIGLFLASKEYAFLYSDDNGTTWNLLWKGRTPKDNGPLTSIAALRAGASSGYALTVDFEYLTIKEIPQIIDGDLIWSADLDKTEDFDDGVIAADLTTHTSGNGSLSESGDSLTLSTTAGTNSVAEVWYEWDDLPVDVRDAGVCEVRITRTGSVADPANVYIRLLISDQAVSNAHLSINLQGGVWRVFYQEPPTYAQSNLWAVNLGQSAQPPWKLKWVWNTSGAGIYYRNTLLANNSAQAWLSQDDGLSWLVPWTGTLPGNLSGNKISRPCWFRCQAVSAAGTFGYEIDYLKVRSLAGSFASGYDGPNSSLSKVSDGWRFVIDKTSKLPSGQNTFNIISENNVSQLGYLTYSFDADLPPEIEIISPTSGAINVGSNAPIIFRTTDNNGILPTGVNIYIKREGEDTFTQIYTGATDTFAEGWSGSYEANDENGYDFTIIPGSSQTYQSLETITVKVEADD